MEFPFSLHVVLSTQKETELVVQKTENETEQERAEFAVKQAALQKENKA